MRDARRRLQPEQFAVVREGLHGGAFLLTPVWMLWHRLWLVFVLYLVRTAALAAGLKTALARVEQNLSSSGWKP